MIKTTHIRNRMIVLLVGLLLTANLYADPPSHFVRASIDGGVTAEFSPSQWKNETNANYGQRLEGSVGGAGSFGLGYRYSKDGFLLDVGVGVGYSYLKNQLADSLASASNFRINGSDTVPGRPAEWNYGSYEKNPNLVMMVDTNFTSRHDYIHRMSIQVPLMVGGEWGSWYALGGVKLNVNIYTKQYETGQWTPGMYMDGLWFKKDPQTGKENGPNDFTPENNILAQGTHTFQQLAGGSDYGEAIMEPVNDNGDLDWRDRRRWEADIPISLDVRLCAEFGYRLNYRNTSRGYHGNEVRTDYYIAAFAEYGVYQYGTSYAPFQFGVRLTAIWEVQKRPPMRWEETHKGNKGKRKVAPRWII